MPESKPKILLSFVGNRDPLALKPCPCGKEHKEWDEIEETKEENEGSIVTICRKLKPSKIYLFPSQAKPGEISPDINKSSFNDLLPMLTPDIKMNNSEINAIAVVKYLKWKNILPDLKEDDIKIIPMNIEDATDISSIYSALRDIVFNEIHNKLSTDERKRYDFCFNISSGTGQMHHVARIYFPVSSIKVKFYQCKEYRFVSTPGERVIEVNEPLMEEIALIERIKSNLEKYHFYSLEEDCNRLKDISELVERKFFAGILAMLFKAYRHMDQMQYKEAYDEISDKILTPHEEKLGLLTDVFKEQIDFLNNIKNNGLYENCYNLTDLYFNMCRAFERKNYADVLVRFWRLREGMLNYRLNYKYRIDIRSRNTYPQFYDFSNDEEGQIRSITNYLIEQGDTEMGDFNVKEEKILDSLRKSRNSSFLAHGMRPVLEALSKDEIFKDVPEGQEEKWLRERLLDLGKTILGLVPGSEPVKNKYPFTKEKMRRLINTLINA